MDAFILDLQRRVEALEDRINNHEDSFGHDHEHDEVSSMLDVLEIAVTELATQPEPEPEPAPEPEEAPAADEDPPPSEEPPAPEPESDDIPESEPERAHFLHRRIGGSND